MGCGDSSPNAFVDQNRDLFVVVVPFVNQLVDFHTSAVKELKRKDEKNEKNKTTKTKQITTTNRRLNQMNSHRRITKNTRH